MKPFRIRPIDPTKDFAQLAAWFSLIEDETSTEIGLHEYYGKNNHRISAQVAEDGTGGLVGFYWLARDRNRAERGYLSLYVKQEARRRGLGSSLYDLMEPGVIAGGMDHILVNVSDACLESQVFAERRGFTKKNHQFSMTLDLNVFTHERYLSLIERLKSEGFIFTSMEALGNTETAQHKLFELNDTSASETPGTNGEHSWSSFEDFQKCVCQSAWYQPAGQMVVIDSANGKWVAMSAITRFDGAQDAFNLFTGVDSTYRGRKLAQAVKVQALCYAREVLKVQTVRTNHNSLNAAMIAIDTKFGYCMLPGTYVMEKRF